MKKGAVIIETREISNLYEIIVNDHLKYLPTDWALTIFLSENNKHLFAGKEFDREVSFKFLSNSELTISQYNQLLTSHSFWNTLPYDKILIFQSDSKILRSGIEQFMKYDYVGAAWSWQLWGGNGGLSLRSKNAMLNAISNKPYNEGAHGNEDVYFSNYLHETNGNLAPRDICEKFSVEAVFGLGSLGIHAIEKYLTPDQCKMILNQYL